MSRKEKKTYEDDAGQTVVNMNVEGMRGYESEKEKKLREEMSELNLTKKEKRALFWGSFRALLPIMFIILTAFGVMVLFAYFWLRP